MGRLKEFNGGNIRDTDTHTFPWSWEASVVVSNEKQAPNLALGGAGAVVLHCRTLYLVPIQGPLPHGPLLHPDFFTVRS